MYFVAKPNEEAKAFIQAAGLIDENQMKAVGTLVIDLKNYNIWDKMKAIYPFVGGTSGSHKFNLKDPRDADSAFRLDFSGSWIHSSTGATPDGSTAYADTKLNLNTELVPSSIHYMGYARTDNSGERMLMGAGTGGGGTDTFLDFYGSLRLYYVLAGPVADISIPSWKGLWHLNALGSNTVLYRNGTSLNTSTRNSTLPSRTLFLGASNAGLPAYFSIQELAFSSIGSGLTDTEAANLYTAVQRFQTTLGRQV